jgi:hypothetical protein
MNTSGASPATKCVPFGGAEIASVTPIPAFRSVVDVVELVELVDVVVANVVVVVGTSRH